MICYDISSIIQYCNFLLKLDRTSFLNTQRWIDDVRAERGPDVLLCLVGNKTDLSTKRQVTVEEAEKKAKDQNLLFCETSAKAGYNIKILFRKIAMELPGGVITEKKDVTEVKLLPAAKVETNIQGCPC